MTIRTLLPALALPIFLTGPLHADTFAFDRLCETARAAAAAPYAPAHLELDAYWKIYIVYKEYLVS